MIFNNGYYHSLDKNYMSASQEGPVEFPSETTPIEGMRLNEIGTATNPMENVLNSVQAKIREGAGRIEFSFIGKGKSNSQQPSPEAFGKDMREDIRALTKLNKIETSTHAAVHMDSLAGLGQNGFERRKSEEALNEIKRAIDFAATATRGGAIVFHTGEWMRPLSELKDNKGAEFKSYDKEQDDAAYYYVDQRTGRFVGQVSKDQELYEPEFERNENGDWVDVDGNPISKNADINRMFDRRPVWDDTQTNFKTTKKGWKDFEKEAKEWNKYHDDDQRDAGQFFLLTQNQNRILQAKGQSLFYAKQYNREKEALGQIREALAHWEKMEKVIPEEEKWQMLTQKVHLDPKIYPPKNVNVIDYLKQQERELRDSLRHIHEASSAADSQAREFTEQLHNIKPIAQVGLQRTADTIARAGMFAMEMTNKNKEHMSQPIYVAPENFDVNMYGSHPQEVIKVVKESRKAMVEQLHDKGYDKDKARKIADKHIRATIDIGHMNLWRRHFQAKPGEDPGKAEKRFEDWVISQAEDMAKAGVIGHVHLTDNFGYNDEHLTAGQGNAPIKRFIETMRKHGVKDFIAEAGSFNGQTVLQETWAQFNSPIYGIGTHKGFGQIKNSHFGYGAPPNYIVGGYVPSNEWKMWSEVPLE